MSVSAFGRITLGSGGINTKIKGMLQLKIGCAITSTLSCKTYLQTTEEQWNSELSLTDGSEIEEGMSIATRPKHHRKKGKRKFKNAKIEGVLVAQAMKLIQEWQSEDGEPMDDFNRFGLCVADQLRDLANSSDMLLVARTKFKIEQVLYQSAKRAYITLKK
ncbi:hypothetical protein TrispH2_010342 [Trichoplax sp. H2]|uniref:Uncharacterized protein n=1 Tax=Trichoplax adhaerens TaxID=10228 RepID=B3S780_TRIAD|nr:predicted protein [Trichoplax adhaerens]EDV21435.1 predicted protein [Trichoplax adhaerens]RDD39719.1 hypothetical protein TrispH2_010342 [Trichoplax sp. H2]|eukprot:XP_002116035.1 predicted protein [Trichoplax adhaerens]